MMAEPAKAYDTALREALTTVLGAPISECSWQIVQMPLNKSGLGLLSPSLHCSAAFVGSVKATSGL